MFLKIRVGGIIMKKLLAIILTLAMIICCVPFGAFAVTANAANVLSGTTGDCSWTLDGTVLTISGNGKTDNYYWDDTPWGCDITEVIVEDGVTYLGDKIFYDCAKLSKVTLGSDLVEIRMDAFGYCESLESIYIPDTVSIIGTDAFYNTGIYNNDDNWQDGVLYIGNHLICAEKNDIDKEYEVKEGTITISNSAFESCGSLVSVVIPETVENIGADAFYNCRDLKDINIPQGVKFIGSNAFYNCNALENVFITDLAAWCNISFGDRYCNPLNYTENFVLNGSVLKDELVIPDGVSVVSDYAFYGFNAISDVTFGKDVTIIGAEAFSDCENLVDAKLPEGLTEIHYRAFYACDLLNNINIPNSVIFIEEMAIDGTAYYDNDANWENGVLYLGRHVYKAAYDKVIGEYEIKEGTLTVAPRAFLGCQEITSVIIPEGVTALYGDAFCYCSKLNSVTLPSSITYIGEYAFDDCDVLCEVYYAGTVDDKAEIVIEKENNPLLQASWHCAETIPSDINGDGTVNVSDLALLKKLLAGLLSEEEAAALNFDIDGNGSVNAADLALLKKVLAGLVSLEDNKDNNDDNNNENEYQLPLEEVPLNIDYQVADDFKIGVIVLHDEKSSYDKNFIDGINKVKTALNLKDEQVIIKTHIMESDDCYVAAKELAQADCDIVFADSYGHEVFLQKAAKEFPDVEFCHASGIMAHTSGLDNFHNGFAKIYEGRYLTGVAAGLKLNELIKNGTISADNAKIGFVGAFNYAECISAQTAFYLGAKSVCPTAVMDVQYAYSWYNVEREQEMAERLIKNGCAVISQYSESPGALMACESAGVANFGYTENFNKDYPNASVVSVKIDWSQYFNYIIGCVAKGEEIAFDWAGGIKEGAVVLSEINSSIAAKGTLEVIRETAVKIANGTLHVFDTNNFTVNGQKLTSYNADIDGDFEPDTNVIENGIFYESTKRSAPYFDLGIDGIRVVY